MGIRISKEDVSLRLIEAARLGLIEQWHNGRPSWGGTATWVIELFDGTKVTYGAQEAYALTLGLFSAHQADQARRASEAEALAAYKAQQAEEAAARRSEESSAVAVTGCPYCEAPAGQRCVRDTEDATPYADHPHKVRLERAAILAGSR